MLTKVKYISVWVMKGVNRDIKLFGDTWILAASMRYVFL